MVQKKKTKTGAFLRWYGPRDGRTHAVFIETRIEPDSPAAFYGEPTRSTLQESMKARGVQPL